MRSSGNPSKVLGIVLSVMEIDVLLSRYQPRYDTIYEIFAELEVA